MFIPTPEQIAARRFTGVLVLVQIVIGAVYLSLRFF